MCNVQGPQWKRRCLQPQARQGNVDLGAVPETQAQSTRRRCPRRRVLSVRSAPSRHPFKVNDALCMSFVLQKTALDECLFIIAVAHGDPARLRLVLSVARHSDERIQSYSRQSLYLPSPLFCLPLLRPSWSAYPSLTTAWCVYPFEQLLGDRLMFQYRTTS